MRVLSADEVAVAAQAACLLEAGPAKPGNVSPGRPFRDMTYEDFMVSAVAIGPAMGAAGGVGLGRTIREAVRATRSWTRANTNLGVILLLAPLARAARSGAGELRERLRHVLEGTTIADAAETYAAIREAAPGGLGEVGSQDVHDTPTVTLQRAMELAADRDTIAAEYLSDFAVTFNTGAAALRAAREDRLPWPEAIIETYLTILAARPDTLIARKLGMPEAERVSDHAAEVIRVGGVRTVEGTRAIAAFDADLRDPQNSLNPGTTADVTAASVFVVLLEDGWTSDRGDVSAR